MKGGFNWLSPKAETRHSKIQGYGTFANAEIYRNELIIAFGGKVIPFSEWLKLPEEVKSKSLAIARDLELSPLRMDSLGDGDYVNHSCEPNAGIKGQIFLVAMRDIHRNEEITFDYAMVLSDPAFHMDCSCGSSICRKIITGDDWKKFELQIRYKGYFSMYIQDKLDRGCTE
jgi:SET domain-containing protein